MKEHNVTVNDLYAFAMPKLAKIQRPANVHFTPEGSAELAKAVAAAIAKQLKP
jgi:lysophospholipase L1-like esterase